MQAWLISSGMSPKEEPWSAFSVTRLQRNARTRLICLLEIASLAIGHSLGRSLQVCSEGSGTLSPFQLLWLFEPHLNSRTVPAWLSAQIPAGDQWQQCLLVLHALDHWQYQFLSWRVGALALILDGQVMSRGSCKREPPALSIPTGQVCATDATMEDEEANEAVSGRQILLSRTSSLWQRLQMLSTAPPQSRLPSRAQCFFFHKCGRRGHGAQIIVEGREEQSDGGEKNKNTQHNPNQTTQSPQAESPPSCSLSSVLGETKRKLVSLPRDTDVSASVVPG